MACLDAKAGNLEMGLPWPGFPSLVAPAAAPRALDGAAPLVASEFRGESSPTYWIQHLEHDSKIGNLNV